MNEQRTQAYLNLINQLLSCNNGDEPRILQKNQELLDRGLVEVMVAVAQQYGNAGRENEARWLLNMAQQLAEALGLFDSEPSSISTGTFDQMPYTVYVLLYNVGTDNEGIHTISVDDNHKILLFESQEDAATFARQLGEQNFPVPSVEAMKAEEIFLFCHQLGHNWEFVPKGKTITPPSQRVENETPKKIKPEDYQIFLDNVLQLSSLIDKNRFNPEAVYTFCQNNLDKLDENFGEFLYQWATNIFSNLHPQKAQFTAAVVLMFGNLINEFPFGSLKNNLEISIKAYQAALIVYHPKTFPVYWAMTQMNMGNVYAKRIEGKKTENIEKAINSFQEALKIYTLDAFPYEYARVQHNMSNVYIERIKGDKAENIKTAIDCCKKALKVRTFEAFPREWANTHIHLVNAYLQTTNLEIIEQKKKENIEIAIGYCENSLIVYNIESFPKEWAKVQNNLGNVYLQRIKGEKEENVEQSINYFLESLRVYKINTFPNEWARGQFNLGGAYLERIKEKKRENLEKAIFYLRESFKVYIYNNFPYEWADSYINLGKAYFERIEGKKTDNLEIAISCFEEALKVYNVDNFPDSFAKIQKNLGTTYRNRIEGDKAKNLEFAIDCYQQALKIYDFKNLPLNWAGVQVDLAEVYIDRIEENKAENLEIAIACCQASLQVVNSDNFPIHWAKTQNTLGNVYQARIKGDKAENLEIAITCFEAALKIYTIERERFAHEWAMSQMNLGNVYHDRIKGEKAENQEKAIDCFKASLELVKPDDFPLEFAMLQNNLGSAYRNRIRGEKADNLEKAISAYQEALKVFTFDAFPQQWAATQNNLANAYSNRIRGDKAENIKQAVMCYQNALQGYETAGDFLNAAEMGLTLGKVKVDRGEWYQGLAYLEKSLKIYRQFDDLKSRADTIYQIAHTHHLIGNHEKASIYYRDASRFYEYLKHDRGVAFCQASLGRLMLQIGFVEKAEELLKKATFIFKELNNEQEIAKIAEVLNCLAKIKEKQAV